MFISLWLRLYKLDFSGFSLDEMISLNIAENFNLLYLFSDNHPPLHTIALKLWTNLFGLSEFMARFPSALFSTGATIVIGFTALKFSNRWVSLLCMLLHAVFPLSIINAQLVRPYALFELASSVQFYFYLIYLQDRTRIRSLLFSSLFAVLSSYLAALLFLFEYVFHQRKNSNVLLIIGVNALIVTLLVLSRELIDWRYLDWQLIKFNLESLSFLPLDLLRAFSYYSPISSIGLVVLCILFVRSLGAEQMNGFYKTTAIVLSFVLSLIVFSLVTRRAIFSERYFIFIIPMFIYIAGSLVKNIYPLHRYLAIFALFFVVGGSTVSIIRKVPQKHPPWKDAAFSISLYGSSIVLTTSSRALQVPYFKNRNIEVEPLFEEDSVAEQLNFLLMDFKNVWIVDTAWNRLLNFSKLNDIVLKANLKIEDHTIYDDASAAVVVLRITR